MTASPSIYTSIRLLDFDLQLLTVIPLLWSQSHCHRSRRPSPSKPLNQGILSSTFDLNPCASSKRSQTNARFPPSTHSPYPSNPILGPAVPSYYLPSYHFTFLTYLTAHIRPPHLISFCFDFVLHLLLLLLLLLQPSCSIQSSY
jgi:hypothetical protein